MHTLCCCYNWRSRANHSRSKRRRRDHCGSEPSNRISEYPLWAPNAAPPVMKGRPLIACSPAVRPYRSTFSFLSCVESAVSRFSLETWDVRQGLLLIMGGYDGGNVAG